MSTAADPASDQLPSEVDGPLVFFRTGGGVRWVVSDPRGRPLADGARWHADVPSARREALMALRVLLDATVADPDAEVARYLAALPADRLRNIIEASGVMAGVAPDD